LPNPPASMAVPGDEISFEAEVNGKKAKVTAFIPD
jgi:hypothetical protein